MKESRAPGRRRRIAGVVILGAVVVFGLAALQWREIAVRWQVARFEGDESPKWLSVEVLLEPEGSIRREALRRFVKTEKGKERLLSRYILLVNSDSNPRMDGIGAGGSKACLAMWVDQKLCFQVWSPEELARPAAPWRGRVISMISLPPTGLEDFAHRLQELLLEVGYHEYPVPDHPGARFSVVSCKDPDPRCARHYPIPLLSGRYTCLFESGPHRLDPPAKEDAALGQR